MYIAARRSGLIGGQAVCSYCHEKIKRGKKMLRVEFERNEISSRAIHQWCLVKMVVKALVKFIPPAKKFPVMHKRICTMCGKEMKVTKTYLTWQPKENIAIMRTRCFACIEGEARAYNEKKQHWFDEGGAR